MRRDTLEAFLHGCGGRFLRSAEGHCWEYQGRRAKRGLAQHQHRLVFRYRWPA